MSSMEYGAKIEGWIRKELGESSPIPWKAANTEESSSLGKTLHEVKLSSFGGNLDTKNTFYFDIPGKRPTSLIVSIVGYLRAFYPAQLFYTTNIAKPTSCDVYLRKEGLLRPKFMFKGDQQICGKLNSDEDLIKLSSRFYKEKVKTGNVTLRIYPMVNVGPAKKGPDSNLVINTLPKFHMLSKPNFGLKEFFALASKIETLL